MEKIKLNEEQIEEYTDIINNFQHILNDILNSVENGEIDEMQLNEAEKQNKMLKTVSVATGSSTIALTIVVILLIIF